MMNKIRDIELVLREIGALCPFSLFKPVFSGSLNKIPFAAKNNGEKGDFYEY